VVAVVFRGGVGDNSGWIRADACAALGFIGVAVDPARNAAPDPGDVDLTAEGSRVRVLRVLAREDLQIASEVRRTLGATAR
jgi:acetate kinase